MRLPLMAFFILGWPLLEIAGFVLVGRAIGLLPTLALVIGTGVFGAFLLRRQGMRILNRIAAEGRRGRVPRRAVIDAATVVVAGILLLLPGFFTDLIGLALFIPPVRDLLWSLIGRRLVVVETAGATVFRSGGSETAKDETVIDLDAADFRRQAPQAGDLPPAPHRPGDR